MKTKIFTLLLLAFIGLSTANAQVGIGTTTPDASSILDVTSTEKGFLPPRMNTTDRDLISSPAEGLTIFNTTVGCVEFYNGSVWINFCDDSIKLGACAGEPSVFTFNSLEYKPVESVGQCWLDRNLGATRVATGSQDFEAYGDLYQWGRGNDGHQIINWVSATASDGAEQSNESSSQSSSPNPGSTFIIGAGKWYNGTNPDDLWKSDLTGVNNPCPAGYRVPSEAEFANLGITDANDAYETLGLTMAGRRVAFDGELASVGIMGVYWTSSISPQLQSKAFSFNGTSAYFDGESRARGFSVRCLKD